MPVRAADGTRVGQVVRLEPAGVLVQRGHIVPRDWLVDWRYLAAVRDEELVLSVGVTGWWR